MALVVLLRGVNVGGHRTFRPSVLAGQLKHLGAVNIGAAGTFLIQRAVGRAELRAELARRLPFETTIVICSGAQLAALMSLDAFAQPAKPGVVRFVSVLCGRPRINPRLPISFPSSGRWLLQIVAREGRFVIGQYRRHMKTIGYFQMLDRIFGVPVTTRNWNTMSAIASKLSDARPADGKRTQMDPKRPMD